MHLPRATYVRGLRLDFKCVLTLQRLSSTELSGYARPRRYYREVVLLFAGSKKNVVIAPSVQIICVDCTFCDRVEKVNENLGGSAKSVT